MIYIKGYSLQQFVLAKDWKQLDIHQLRSSYLHIFMGWKTKQPYIWNCSHYLLEEKGTTTEGRYFIIHPLVSFESWNTWIYKLLKINNWVNRLLPKPSAPACSGSPRTLHPRWACLGWHILTLEIQLHDRDDLCSTVAPWPLASLCPNSL